MSMLKVHFTTQHFIYYQPEYFPIIRISRLVHMDTSDSTHNCADLICHATQSLWRIQTHPIRHASVLASSVMPPNTSNPSSWRCNRIITSGSQWQCFTCMLVRVYQHVHKSLNSQTVNFHQAYAITLTQRFNNGTLHLKVTRQ